MTSTLTSNGAGMSLVCIERRGRRVKAQERGVLCDVLDCWT